MHWAVKKTKLTLVILTLLFLPIRILGQFIPFSLPIPFQDKTDFVYSVIKDKNGFLWFATERGVLKWDGISLKVFSTRNGMFSDDIWEIVEDRDGVIWCFSHGKGINWIMDDMVYTYPYPDIIIEEKITAGPYFINPEPGHYMLGMSKGMLVWNSSGEFKLVKIRAQELTRGLIPINKNLCTDLKNLFHIRGNGIVQRLAFPYNNDAHYQKRWFQVSDSIYAYQQHEFDVGLRFYDVKNSIHRLISFDSVLGFLPTRHTLIGVSNGGVWFKADDRFFQYKNDVALEFNEFKDIKPQRILEDRDRNTWVCTKGNGLYIGPKARINYQPLYFPKSKQNLNGSFIFKSSNEEILVTGGNSIYKISNNQIRQFIELPPLNERAILPFNLGVPLLKEQYTYWLSDYLFLHKNSDNTTISSSLTISDLSRKTNYSFSFPNFLIPSAQPKDFLQIGDSMVIAASYKGLSYVFYSNNKWHFSQIQIGRANGIEKIGENLFIGTSTGLWSLPVNAITLNNNESVVCSFKEPIKNLITYRSKLIIATESGEIYQFNPKTCESRLIVKQVFITTMAEKDKDLYFGTDQELIIYRSNGTLERYGTLDGYPKGGLKHMVPYEKYGVYGIKNSDEKGEVLNIQLTPTFFENIPEPKIILIETHEGKEKIYSNVINIKSENITIYLTKKIYGFSSRFVLEMRSIPSIDTNWRELPSNQVALAGLGPRWHQFEFRYKDILTKKTSLKTNFAIYIIPKWYQNHLFQILGFIIIVSTLIFISLFIYRTQIKKKQTRQKLMELEILAFKSQIKPHFLFNTLNGIQAQLLKNEIKNAINYISTFSKLLRLYLDANYDTYTSIEKEVEILEKYVDMEKLRFPNRFTFEIDIQKEINKQKEKIPGGLIQPFIENAIIHAFEDPEKTGVITLKINLLDEKFLVIFISDNGIGINKGLMKANNYGKKSFGNIIIRSRIEAWNQIDPENASMEIIDHSETNHPEENGTTIVLTFKRQKL